MASRARWGWCDLRLRPSVLIHARQNTGFTVPPAADWAQWRTEDAEYAHEADAVRHEVTGIWERLA